MNKYGGLLASFYDSDHLWRDYSKQSVFVAGLLRHSSSRAAGGEGNEIRVIDLCCGSGSHAVRLAAEGFTVTGVDNSGPMLELAQNKSAGWDVQAVFKQRDVFSADFSREFKSEFDAAILIGWTLAIRPVFKRFKDLLSAAAEVLRPGGLFIFDVPLGANFNRPPSAPLRYEVSPHLKGTLRITEEADGRDSQRTYRYDWDIQTRPPAGKKFARVKLSAREELSVLEAGDVLSPVRGFGRFDILMLCREYRPDRPYRPGDKNLVAVLGKR